MKPLKFFVFLTACLLVIPILMFLFTGFAIYIYPNYLSSVAQINKQINNNDSCREVYAKLYEYKNSDPINISISEVSPKNNNDPNLSTTISLSDDTTPFDMINFYVYCGKNDQVLGIKIVGD